MLKVARPRTRVEFELISRFESIRHRLLAQAGAVELQRPLAYWALPKDRRLPRVFLRRTVRELLEQSLDDLRATPGVGRKKISSLVNLLGRAAAEQPPIVGSNPLRGAEARPAGEATGALAAQSVVDTASVSEALWTRWREAVMTHGLGHAPLGQFAPSLERLPRVVWHTPLEDYARRSLAEIRRLKTHGEKRVSAVLEVFGTIHASIGRIEPGGPLAARLLTSHVAQCEDWVCRNEHECRPPDNGQVRAELIEPLLAQLTIDAGQATAALAAGRLGLVGSTSSVRQAARQMRLTRARIYQLFDDMAEIVGIRWPGGRALVREMSDRLSLAAETGEDRGLLAAAVELFFPEPRQRGRCQARLLHREQNHGIRHPACATAGIGGGEPSSWLV